MSKNLFLIVDYYTEGELGTKGAGKRKELWIYFLVESQRWLIFYGVRTLSWVCLLLNKDLCSQSPLSHFLPV